MKSIATFTATVFAASLLIVAGLAQSATARVVREKATTYSLVSLSAAHLKEVRTPSPTPSDPSPAGVAPTAEVIPAAQVAPAPGATRAPEVAPAPAPAANPCCPPPCISYREHGCRKICCGCDPPVKSVLHVKDPASCDCCVTDLPICLPACCTGEPEVCCKVGLFGRGIVDYYWCCGFHTRVVFTNCGDVIVHYYGR